MSFCRPFENRRSWFLVVHGFCLCCCQTSLTRSIRTRFSLRGREISVAGFHRGSLRWLCEQLAGFLDLPRRIKFTIVAVNRIATLPLSTLPRGKVRPIIWRRNIGNSDAVSTGVTSLHPFNRRLNLLILSVLSLMSALTSLTAQPPATSPTPPVVLNILNFGAVGDGIHMNGPAIQKAINQAAASPGGGTVIIPAGRFLTGTIQLKSRVRLHLEKDAVLLGSTNLNDYQRLNFLALIMANGQHDLSITGEGTIDGQGKPIAESVREAIQPGKYPTAGEGKRPVIINFRKCRNVWVKGITLRESACWVQLYRDCDRVILENLTVRTMAAITNDGLDIDGCRDVIVRHCDIDSEDDAVCLKSSGRICENVLVEHCRIRSSCNAVKFGTASFGGFRNITCRNLTIYDTYISAITLQSVDGGIIDNVRISKVKITDTNNAFFIRLGHRNAKKPPGSVKNIVIEDVDVDLPDRPKSAMNKFPSYWRHQCTTLVTSSIAGLPGHPIQNVTFRNIRMTHAGIGPTHKPGQHRIEALNQIPEREDSYPECKIFGILPAWGFFCRHVEGITFEQVSLRVLGKDHRPALVADDVKSLRLVDFRAESSHSSHGVVLRNSPNPLMQRASGVQRGPWQTVLSE